MPTSGEAPYVLSASIDNLSNIDGINYRASLLSRNASGFCPARGSSANLSQLVDTLIDTGSVTISEDVSQGVCRTYTLDIFRVSDGARVDSLSVSISNI